MVIILKKHNLTYTINKDDNELIIEQGKAIFIESELIAEDYDLIKKGELTKVFINAFKIQIENDLESIELGINDDDIINVVLYTQECFSIYNELLNCI